MNYYYSAKLRWSEPKEGTDEMKKMSKNFLVYSHSCTEAEARVINWCPANYQDAIVEEVKQTTFGEVKIIGATETFWSVKWMDDNDGRDAKAKPFTVIVNAVSAEEALEKSKSCSSFGDIEEVKRFKGIVDEDLISEEILKK
jgi:hypothetical protein